MDLGIEGVVETSDGMARSWQGCGECAGSENPIFDGAINGWPLTRQLFLGIAFFWIMLNNVDRTGRKKVWEKGDD